MATPAQAANDNTSKPRIGLLAAIVCVAIAISLDALQVFLMLFYGLSVISTATATASAGAAIASAVTVVGIPFALVAGTFSAASAALAASSAALAFLGPWLVTLLAILGFGLYFMLSGVRFLSGKRMFPRIAGAFFSAASETTPLFNGFPSITSGVLTVILTSRKEDALMHEEASAEPVQRNPLPRAANDNAPPPRREIPTVPRRAA